jgi:hypothetical protein
MIKLTDRYTLFISFDGLTGAFERGKIVPYKVSPSMASKVPIRAFICGCLSIKCYLG